MTLQILHKANLRVHKSLHAYSAAALQPRLPWPLGSVEMTEDVWCLTQYCCTNNSLSLCCVAATESSETSSQCTSSDSVTGLSTLTIPGHQGNVMDSYNNNNNDSPSFLCSSTPPSSNASPLIFQKEEDLQTPSTKFITAVSVDCLPYYLLILRTSC